MQFLYAWPPELFSGCANLRLESSAPPGFVRTAIGNNALDWAPLSFEARSRELPRYEILVLESTSASSGVSEIFAKKVCPT